MIPSLKSQSETNATGANLAPAAMNDDAVRVEAVHHDARPREARQHLAILLRLVVAIVEPGAGKLGIVA